MAEATVEPSKSRRLYLLLRDRLRAGDWAPGARLPSEPDLAARHGVARVTVRRALDALEAEGLIRRQPGAGTFAAPAGPKPLVADFANLLAHIVEMGRATGVRLLSFGYAPAPAAVAEALGLPPGACTQVSVRVRLIDGAPFSHLVTHVPEAIGVSYSEADLASTPLLALLERSGVTVDTARQTMTAALAGPEVAAALDVAVGAALLGVERTVHDRDGRGVEHLSALYRPDRYVFRMDLARTGDHGARAWAPAPLGAADPHSQTARSRAASPQPGAAPRPNRELPR